MAANSYGTSSAPHRRVPVKNDDSYNPHGPKSTRIAAPQKAPTAVTGPTGLVNGGTLMPAGGASLRGARRHDVCPPCAGCGH